jgi:predicted nucleic acid-binding protein
MFWDSSALVPVLLPEARSDVLTALLTADKEIVIWWATPLECQSAIYRRHPLRAADALQLAAALIWCEEQPHGETFVSLDDRLRGAASKEGFTLAP